MQRMVPIRLPLEPMTRQPERLNPRMSERTSTRDDVVQEPVSRLSIQAV